MIIPPTDCFWKVKVEDEAAKAITALVSKDSIDDIQEAMLISRDFDNDVQASIELDNVIDLMKSYLDIDFIESANINPLYVPSTTEQLDSVLENDEGAEGIAFTGMDGSPFTLKMIEITTADDREVIKAKLTCRPFELPSYSEIIHNQANLRLN